MKNIHNLELKHFCDDFLDIRKVLREIGAKKEVVKNQKDYFFSLPAEKKRTNGRLKLRVENKSMHLLYYERASFAKGKETPSRVSMVDADKAILSFLEQALGVIGIVQKRREVWRLEHVVFHLDTVKGVGTIFEVELQKHGKISATDRTLFRSYEKQFAPFLGKVVKGSNIDLVLKGTK